MQNRKVGIANIALAQKAEAEARNNVENRIGTANRLKRGGQIIDHIKCARKHRQRRNHEVGDRGVMVEFLRPDRCQDPDQRQQDRTHKAEPNNRPHMRDAQIHARPQRHGRSNRESDQNRACYGRANQRRHQFARADGGHQIIDDRALDLADKQAEAGIGEGIVDHRHCNQAGCHKGGKVHAQHNPAAATGSTAQSQRENHQIKQRGYSRCPDRLGLHLEETPDFLHIESPQPQPVEAAKYRLPWWSEGSGVAGVRFVGGDPILGQRLNGHVSAVSRGQANGKNCRPGIVARTEENGRALPLRMKDV